MYEMQRRADLNSLPAANLNDPHFFTFSGYAFDGTFDVLGLQTCGLGDAINSFSLTTDCFRCVAVSKSTPLWRFCRMPIYRWINGIEGQLLLSIP